VCVSACERVSERARRVQPRGRAGEDEDDDGMEDGANERGKSRAKAGRGLVGDDGCAAVTGSKGLGCNADGSSKEGRYVTVRVRVRAHAPRMGASNFAEDGSLEFREVLHASRAVPYKL
jgi:hypothetical protein